jgi:hypothetical protein
MGWARWTYPDEAEIDFVLLHTGRLRMIVLLRNGGRRLV